MYAYLAQFIGSWYLQENLCASYQVWACSHSFGTLNSVIAFCDPSTKTIRVSRAFGRNTLSRLWRETTNASLGKEGTVEGQDKTFLNFLVVIHWCWFYDSTGGCWINQNQNLSTTRHYYWVLIHVAFITLLFREGCCRESALLTRGWGRLQTRLPVALGSSQPNYWTKRMTRTD